MSPHPPWPQHVPSCLIIMRDLRPRGACGSKDRAREPRRLEQRNKRSTAAASSAALRLRLWPIFKVAPRDRSARFGGGLCPARYSYCSYFGPIPLNGHAASCQSCHRAPQATPAGRRCASSWVALHSRLGWRGVLAGRVASNCPCFLCCPLSMRILRCSPVYAVYPARSSLP